MWSQAATLFVAVSLASLLFDAAAPRVAPRIPPAAATWILSTGALALAAAMVAVPALAVLVVAGQVPLAAAAGHWSATRLAAALPIHGAVAVAAVALSAAQALRLAAATADQGRSLGRAWIIARSAPPLIVVPDCRPAAFALPGWPGRIVASRRLLNALGPAETRALLAHEQAHLDEHHDLHLAVAALAPAVNPLLRAVPAALRRATERSADERAAKAVGDRPLVASTIALVAGHQSGPAPAGGFVMAAAGAGLDERVAALMRPPAAHRPLAEMFLVALVLAVVVAVTTGMFDVKHLFEIAETARHR